MSFYTHASGDEIPHGYLQSHDIYGQSFNGYTNVFEVQLFNGVISDITGSRVISTPTSIFSMSLGSTMLPPTQLEVVLYRK